MHGGGGGGGLKAFFACVHLLFARHHPSDGDTELCELCFFFLKALLRLLLVAPFAWYTVRCTIAIAWHRMQSDGTQSKVLQSRTLRVNGDFQEQDRLRSFYVHG